MSEATIVALYDYYKDASQAVSDLIQAGAVKVLPGNQVQALRQNYAAGGWTEAGRRSQPAGAGSRVL